MNIACPVRMALLYVVAAARHAYAGPKPAMLYVSSIYE